MRKPAKHQVAFRFPIELLARLDQHVDDLRDEHPGTRVNRSKVVRELLDEALPVLREPEVKDTTQSTFEW